ncbi:MAG: fatty acid desaturase family protein [Chthoniobacterales bacterium]
MNETTLTVKPEAPAGFEPWAHHAAFSLVAGLFYTTMGVMALCLYQGWIWPLIPLVLLSSHLMHAMLIAFHEAAHGNLRKSKLLNEIDGIVVGMISVTPFMLYRALHQKHHVNLATEKDVELWPFVDPQEPLWWRRVAAFLELNFGFFYTPYLFWRVFLQRPSPVTNRAVRRRIWVETAGMILFWGTVLGLVAYFQVWTWFLVLYFIPAFIAGNLQSWRKYIEHVGLSGNTGRSATRSIVGDTLPGRIVSISLLHQPLHGVHHIKSSLPHEQLSDHVDWLMPEDDGDTVPFPTYRAAFADLLKCLADPRVGGQWATASAPRAT